MYTWLKDLRYALRTLGKNPGFTAIAVLTLALGIGANAAIFTVVKGILLAPLTYPEADRVMVVFESNPSGGFPRFSMSPLNFRDFHDRNSTFEAFAARNGGSFNLTADGVEPERLRGAYLSGEFFDVAQVPPLIGRVFGPAEDRPGGDKVVVLNHGLWQRRFGGDSGILGREIRLNGEQHTVIGVMPPRFDVSRELFVPMAMAYEEVPRGAHFLLAFGRLKDGVTREEAAADLAAVAAQLEQAYPDSNTGWTAVPMELQELIVEGIRPALLILLGAVALVLLIACANVAHLLLARMAIRQREIALRVALGAGRLRLIGQFLTESLVLALCGGALGALLAHWGTRALLVLYADHLPRSENIQLDGGVLLFTLAVALVTGLIFGLLPALGASRPNLGETLKEGGRSQSGGVGGQRLRKALVLGEVAVSLVLLIGAGLLIRSFAGLLAVDPGFKTHAGLTARIDLPAAKYDEGAPQIAFYRQLFERLEGLPGTSGMAAVYPMPLTNEGFVLTFNGEGWPIPEPNQSPFANVRVISPGYFKTLGIPLLAGRELTLADDENGEPVAIINESTAAKYWPDQDPLGQRITFGDQEDEDPDTWLRIVGIVGDVHHDGLDAATEPEIYWPMLQDPENGATLILRSAGGDPSLLAGVLRQAVRELDPELPIFGIQTLEEIVTSSVAQPRFNTLLLSLFAGLALVLAAIGIYGLVNYSVTQRQQELGIRLALGADRRHILSQVLGRGMSPVLIGLGIGLAAAFLSSRILQSLVYGVSATDLWTFAGVTGVLALVAVLACSLPAFRATRIDPVEVLRDE